MEPVQETQDLGGWGAILMYKDAKKEISGGMKNTTNNIANIFVVFLFIFSPSHSLI